LWDFDIAQDCQIAEVGNDFVQQIDALAGKVSCLHRQASDIAAWPRQACDQTAADGVGRQRKNDGDD
jgi:hypothetical protein